jgi:hypothetical protein
MPTTRAIERQAARVRAAALKKIMRRYKRKHARELADLGRGLGLGLGES